jgi:hypothetical protein
LRAAVAPALALAAFGLGAPSCGGADAKRPPAGADESERQIAFESESELRLGFRRQEDVIAQVTPAAEGVLVRFALLGETADAALGSSEVATTADGRAVVSLYTPSREANFVLRARLAEGAVAERGVAVTSAEPGAAQIEVEPSYVGTRTIPGWVAQVRPGRACEAPDALPPPPTGRPPLTVAGGFEGTLTLYNVPPGAPLSLVVWGGPLARGCSDLPAGVPTGAFVSANVTAQNVKLNLAGLELPFALGLETVPPTFPPLLAAWSLAFSAPFRAGDEGEAEPLRGAAALLAAMREGLDPANVAGRQTFGEKIPAWKPRLATLSGGMPNAAVAGWLNGASGVLGGGPAVAGRAVASGGPGGRYRLADATLFGVPAVDVAGATIDDVDLTFDANDLVTVRGTASFDRAALLAGAVARFLGVAPASAAFDELLYGMVSCEAVADVLTNGGAGEAFEGCGTSCDAGACRACAAELCRGALGAMWGAASTAGARPFELTFSGSATAEVGAMLEPAGWRQGAWVGAVIDAESQAPVAELSGPARSP